MHDDLPSLDWWQASSKGCTLSRLPLITTQCDVTCSVSRHADPGQVILEIDGDEDGTDVFDMSMITSSCGPQQHGCKRVRLSSIKALQARQQQSHLSVDASTTYNPLYGVKHKSSSDLSDRPVAAQQSADAGAGINIGPEDIGFLFSLNQENRKKHLSLRQVLQVSEDLISGLSYLHNRRFVDKSPGAFPALPAALQGLVSQGFADKLQMAISAAKIVHRGGASPCACTYAWNPFFEHWTTLRQYDECRRFVLRPAELF